MNFSRNKRRALISGLIILPAVARTTGATLNFFDIQFAQRHQVIEGFGSSINAYATDIASIHQQDYYLNYYREILGASALRIELWGNLATVPRERWQDISWRDLNFQGPGVRGTVTVEVAKYLTFASAGKLRVIATAWSPPAWMKINAAWGNEHPQRRNFSLNLEDPAERGVWAKPRGGAEGDERFKYLAMNKLRPDRYLHFAKYLVEWVRFFRTRGISLYALSPANEPRFSHWFGSCVYTPEEYSELVNTIAWMFTNQGEPPIPIFGPEHMAWDTVGNRRYLDTLKSKGAIPSLTAVASHDYMDGYLADRRRASILEFKNLAASYGKKIWITEGGLGSHEWPATLHQFGTSLLHALRDGDVSLITTWQYLTRYPPEEDGLMSIRGPTKKTAVAMQFWRFIRPGMTRISVEIDGTLDAVAFEDAESETTVLVVLNLTKTNASFALKLTGKRLASIESIFATDELRDCARLGGRHDPRSLALTPETVATMVLKTRPAR